MNTSLFPDINVWLPLAHPVHSQREAVMRWAASLHPEDRFHFCRFSQLSMLRLLTNESAMGADVVSQAKAWQIYDVFVSNGRTFLAEEPLGLEAEFRKLTSKTVSSTKEWSDSYLSSFARLSGFTFVTFDRALAARTPGSILIDP